MGARSLLGIRDESGELYIGTKDGVLKVRTFRSYVALSDRWDAASLIDINGLPWEPVPGREGIEVKASVSFAKEVDGSRLQHETAEEKPRQPRAVYINKSDVKRYGMTLGCDGCLKVNRGEESSNRSDQTENWKAYVGGAGARV